MLAVAVSLMLGAGTVQTAEWEHYTIKASPAGTVTIYSSKDTCVSQINKDVNYGSAKIMYVESWPDNIHSLIEFPLDKIPTGANILSTRVYFMAGDTVGYPANQTFSRITSPWEELTATWSNQPSVTTEDEVTVLVPWLDGGGHIDFDITKLVKDAWREGQKSCGFRIRRSSLLDTINIMFYCTKEAAYASWYPYIIVTYETAAINYTLTTSVQPTGSGTVSLTPPGPTYAQGTVVTLQANPSSGYTFSYWSGDVSGTSPTIQITMNSNKTVTANFTPVIRKYTLTTYVQPSGSGTIALSPSQPTAGYDEGTIVEVVATAASGYYFDHWSGDASGNTPSISVTMNSNKTITANFTLTPVKYTLTTRVQPFGYGTITVSPPGEILPSIPEIRVSRYDAGTIVNITATPASGYIFSHWSGNASGTSQTIQITMNSDKDITANFVIIPPPQTYILVTSAVGNGTVAPSGTTEYNAGESVTVTATPDSGWTFDHWSGDLSGSQNPAVVIMNDNKNIVAYFMEKTPETVTLTMVSSPLEGGTIQASIAQVVTATFPKGATVSITAFPNEGWVFDTWSGDITGTSATTSIKMDTDKIVVANFVKSLWETLREYQTEIILAAIATAVIVSIVIAVRRR